MAYRYKTTKINGKTKLVHRHLMELHIGRPLSKSEHVHHVNGDCHDNRIENLQLMDGDSHRTEHADKRLIYPRDKECEICGTVFTPHPSKRLRNRTCSIPCRNKLISITERQTKAKAPVAAALVGKNLSNMAIRRAA